MLPETVRPNVHPRILFFDDDDDILELCAHILADRGYDVYTRSSTAGVIEYVASISPDVIFMDNRIPDLGGVEATRCLKRDQQLRAIPVVLFSGNADVNYLSKEAGADAYLPKPFDIAALEEAIRRALTATGQALAA